MNIELRRSNEKVGGEGWDPPTNTYSQFDFDCFEFNGRFSNDKNKDIIYSHRNSSVTPKQDRPRFSFGF